MKVGDLVCIALPAKEKGKPVGIILGFSVDWLIHRYDSPEYRILWQHGGVGVASEMSLRKLNESR